MTGSFNLLMTDSPSRVARNSLAEGLAAHLGHWSERKGSSSADIALLRRAARELALAACDGHVCLPLESCAGVSADEARHALLASGAAVEAGSRMLAAIAWPLVIDGERLYLRACFDLETRLAAALSALSGRLSIVSGGPGTGKTTTAANRIAQLIENEPDLRIMLAAPTGKAAARLREALNARAQGLPETVRARLPAEAHTIHRLLGAGSTPGRFLHHADNPLALDLLVVDEASMLDLALAVHLVEALPAQARLMLLGDKDQLAAVEAGAVFADLCDGGSELLLGDCLVWLTESHRFRADSGIGRLAREINAGEGASALGWLRANADPAVVWMEDEMSGNAPSAAALAAMENGYAAYFAELRDHPAWETLDVYASRVFAAFDRFRVLVAVRDGPRGLAAINAHLERYAREALEIPALTGPFWPGRPIIVLKNDPVTKLFNGDIGVCLPGSGGASRVVFPSSGGYRAVLPGRLPEHDTAFALTVHKSQGSEFDEALLLLPATPVRVLSRELLYTAVTRAARRVRIAGTGAVFEAACATRNLRFSGLKDRLRSGVSA